LLFVFKYTKLIGLASVLVTTHNNGKRMEDQQGQEK